MTALCSVVLCPRFVPCCLCPCCLLVPLVVCHCSPGQGWLWRLGVIWERHGATRGGRGRVRGWVWPVPDTRYSGECVPGGLKCCSQHVVRPSPCSSWPTGWSSEGFVTGVLDNIFRQTAVGVVNDIFVLT